MGCQTHIGGLINENSYWIKLVVKLDKNKREFFGCSKLMWWYIYVMVVEHNKKKGQFLYISGSKSVQKIEWIDKPNRTACFFFNKAIQFYLLKTERGRFGCWLCNIQRRLDPNWSINIYILIWFLYW